LSAFSQAIADAADGFDVGGGAVADLLPQQVDVGLDRVRRQGDAIRPGVVEQLIARENLAGPPQQAFEDRELALAQIDRLACDGDAPGGFVQLERAGPCKAIALRVGGRLPNARSRASNSS
jgi:hypothetical protein